LRISLNRSGIPAAQKDRRRCLSGSEQWALPDRRFRMGNRHQTRCRERPIGSWWRRPSCVGWRVLRLTRRLNSMPRASSG